MLPNELKMGSEWTFHEIVSNACNQKNQIKTIEMIEQTESKTRWTIIRPIYKTNSQF